MRMNTGYNREGEYDHFVVNEQKPLLEWLLENVKESRTKVKATLQGRGIKVNGKTVTQFDYLLEPGMKVAVSKSKRNQQSFKSRYVKIVYEDRWLIVIEKQIGILSMAAGHASLNVKAVLDDYKYSGESEVKQLTVNGTDPLFKEKNAKVTVKLDTESDGFVTLTVDGNEVEGCIVPVSGDGKTHQVEVVLG